MNSNKKIALDEVEFQFRDWLNKVPLTGENREELEKLIIKLRYLID